MRAQRFGHYTLFERLGEGGMAAVFLAGEFKSIGLERLVAIKRIHPHLSVNERFASMLIDEANIAGKLTHANIARIFDAGHIDDDYYIAMEYVHGRDLRAIFNHHQKRNQPVPIEQSCHLVMALCEGLDYAHNFRDYSGRTVGLVHRDISPHNLILSFDGALKIIDFGVAKVIGRRVTTQSGAIRGKLTYMSPEQVRGLPVDHRSDIFSAGIVLYEFITGRRLFRARNLAQTLRRVHEVVIPPPRQLRAEIPAVLEAIVLRALAKDPRDRFRSAMEFHAALMHFVQKQGCYSTRSRVANWMKDLFSREYDVESARTAWLWERARTEAGATAKQRAGSPTPARPGRKICERNRAKVVTSPFANTTPGWQPAKLLTRPHLRTRPPRRHSINQVDDSQDRVVT